MEAWPIYIGSVDDEVSRYPWAKPITKRYIDAIFLKCLLVGQNPVVNDGHLFQNRHLRDLAFQGEPSYFKHLVEHSYVWISRRTARLSDLPATLADRGNVSFQSDFSQIMSDVKPFEAILDRSKTAIAAPSVDAVSVAFTELAKQAITAPIESLAIMDRIVSEETWKRFCDHYISEIENSPNPSRQQWIFAIDKLLAERVELRPEGDEVRRKLMNLANEVHHINTARCLHSNLSTKVGVETGARPWTLDYLMADDVMVSSPTSFGAVLNVPWPNTILKPASIDMLLSDNHEVGRARLNFIKTLRGYRDGSASLEQLKEVGGAYGTLLHEDFSKPVWKDVTSKVLSLTFAGVTFAVTSAVTLSPLIGGIAAGLVWMLDQAGPPALAQLVPSPRLRDRFVEQAGTRSPMAPTVAAPIVKTVSASLK